MRYATHIKRIIFLITLGILLIIPSVLLAQQETFVPLSPIPGVTSATSFSGFLNAAFKIGLAATAILAVVWITYGGFEYMTTDSITGKTTGKEHIQDAVIGLLIALLIWVILYTINPNLLNFNIRVSPPPGSSQDTARTQSERGAMSEKKGGAGLIPPGADTVDPGNPGS